MSQTLRHGDLDAAATPAEVGAVISELYLHFFARYGDETLASVATSAVLNDLLIEADRASSEVP